MTPDNAIAILDRALARNGQTVSLRRGNSAAGEQVMQAFVRGVTADEVVGTITQSHKKVTISPSGLQGADLPAVGARVVVDGVPRAIEIAPEVIRMNDVVVRINILVKG
ncbi:hypothetical protein [Rhizobium sp. CSW-27]|uniref:hypothetical protein n=1 Tax=Rhizobium sp. CSW-27 TaxID=2839985 RepID=UPI001C0154D4|nr:hypothetical protein [Rhizobium sp. CSW-27]MBT9370278.1 hypothetical protein [Rhizobium sp. CSW-27]